MNYAPLTRDEVKSVINGKSRAPRIPVFIHMWVHDETFGPRQEEILQILRKYPADIQKIYLRIPEIFTAPADDPGYRWLPFDKPSSEKASGIEEQVGIDDWNKLDEVIAKFPNPNYKNLLANNVAADGRYRLGHWWFGLFERHWSLRGMTNALMDYYTNPDEVHRLFRALTDFYKRLIERIGMEAKCDGVFFSDDLGTQTCPFFSPDIFKEFFLPYYTELFGKAHALGMHSWLHACGNIKPFIPELIGAGLDVLHPIQKYTMDERDIAATFGGRITFFAGMDVQQTIPWGTPEQVRAEVRHLIDTYWRPGEGRCMITAGNGINQDCTTESLEAFFNEAFTYGTQRANAK